MPQVSASKFLVMASWSDVPHLDQKTRDELLESTPPWQRKARSMGIPVLGSGLIFPVSEDAIKCDAFPIPTHWPRLRGMDFGWDHPTAHVELAWDRDTDAVYVTSVYAESQKRIDEHASALKRISPDWVPIAWPHDGLQHDKKAGAQLAESYREEGLPMLSEMATWPEKSHDGGTAEGNDISSRVSVEAGVQDMLLRMQQGRLKVFRHCELFFTEMRMYHRKEGKIVKLFDDVISATRYAIMMLRFAKTEPRRQDFRKLRDSGGGSWKTR